MSLTSHRPLSLVFWDEVPPGANRIPPVEAIAQVDAWFHDPLRRGELFRVWHLLTEQRPNARGGMSWMEMNRVLKPQIVRALDHGQLVMVSDEGNEAWRSSPEMQPEAPATPVSVLDDTPSPVKTWIEFLVQDMAGQPLAGRKYRATLVDGTVHRGETDKNGLARFDGIDPGLCEFVLEGLDGAAWETADEGRDWIEFLVTDLEEKPLADVRWEAKLTNGSTRSGRTDDSGLVRFESLRSGICEFRLPDIPAGDVKDANEATDWIELVLTDAAGEPASEVAWEATLADGATRTGTSGEDGLVRIAGIRTGKVAVRFLDVEAELEGSEDPHARKLGNVEFQLVGVDDRPVSGVRFVLDCADGTQKEGVTDGEGRGRIEQVEAGGHSLSFPDVDASGWEAA